MSWPKHGISVGDTLTPLGVQLKQIGEDGVLAVVPLTGKTVKFSMVDANGTKIVDKSATGVTVVEEATGKVKYDFRAADVDTAGMFTAYFHVYDGEECDTFPAPHEQLLIVIRPIA